MEIFFALVAALIKPDAPILAAPYNWVNISVSAPTAVSLAASSAFPANLPNTESLKYFSNLAAFPWLNLISSSFRASEISAVKEANP